jgi:hypothetical protein
MECPSSDANIDVFPKFVAAGESDEDLDTIGVAVLAPATCSTGGPAHGRDDDNLAVVSLVLWTMTPSSRVPTEAAPTKPQWSFSIVELDTMVSTRCLAMWYDGDITLLTLAFKFDVAPVIKQQGQLLRPSP